MNSQQTFFSSLFDTTFSSLIVPRLVRIFFIIGLVGGALFTLGFIGSMFAGSTVAGFFGLLFSPVIFIAYAIMVRIYCEMILVQFEIHANIEKLANHVTGGSGSSFTPPPVDGQGVVYNPSGPSAPSAPASSGGAGGWGGGASPAQPAQPVQPSAPSSPSAPSAGSGWGGDAKPAQSGGSGWGNEGSSGGSSGSSGGGWS